MANSYDVSDRPEPVMEYTRHEQVAIGSLRVAGAITQMWALEPGSQRELLFLAFMAEFLPAGPEGPGDDTLFEDMEKGLL